MTTPTHERIGAILLRVSSKRQAEEGKASYHVQLGDCHAYAAAKGVSVPADLIWQDIAERDSYYTRDGLQAALTAAKAGRYQVLIVWRMDRLTDDPARLLKIVDDLAKDGVTIMYATEPDTNTDTDVGRFLAYAKALFQVQPERKTLALRTSSARRSYTLAGRPLVGNRPRYGYRLVVDMSRTVRRGDVLVPLKERFEPDPVTAVVVQQLYAWVDAGKSLMWIARALSGTVEGGIYKTPTPRQYAHMAGANAKGVWDQASINTMLAFPGYMGRWPAYRTKREKRTDDSERVRHVPITEDRWVWVKPSPAPALVTEAQWRRVQARLANNKLYSARSRSRRIDARQALLHTGMGRCGLCGGPMEARPCDHTWDWPDGTRVYQYQCHASRKNHPACKGVYRMVAALDRAVQSALVALLRDPDTLRRLAKRSQDRDRAEAEGVALITPTDTAAELKRRLEDKERALVNLAARSEALAPDDPAVLGYELHMRALGSEVQVLRGEYAQAEKNATHYEQIEQVIGEWEDYLELWQDNLEHLGSIYYLDAPECREAHRRWLEMLGARVVVHPRADATLPLATLQVHLTRLDHAAKPLPPTEPPVEVPVVPVAPEPLRHGGRHRHDLPYIPPAGSTITLAELVGEVDGGPTDARSSARAPARASRASSRRAADRSAARHEPPG